MLRERARKGAFHPANGTRGVGGVRKDSSEFHERREYGLSAFEAQLKT